MFYTTLTETRYAWGFPDEAPKTSRNEYLETTTGVVAGVTPIPFQSSSSRMRFSSNRPRS